MNQIDPELERILLQRIVKALHQARYYPAEHLDVQATAREIIRPFLTPIPTLTDKVKL